MAGEPKPEGLTVDDMIVQLQIVSWSGKGKYRVTADATNGQPRFFTKTDLLLCDETKTVDLHPYGAYK